MQMHLGGEALNTSVCVALRSSTDMRRCVKDCHPPYASFEEICAVHEQISMQAPGCEVELVPGVSASEYFDMGFLVFSLDDGEWNLKAPLQPVRRAWAWLGTGRREWRDRKQNGRERTIRGRNQF
jgi:hypothetical protein